MKKMMFLMAALLVSMAVFAQTNSGAAPAKTTAPYSSETTKLVEKYGLDLTQTAKMEKVMIQKAKNLTGIEQLKTQNPEKYRAKLQNILTGTRASQAHILNTKEQREIHRKMLVEIRERRAAKTLELKRQNAPKETVEQALLEIEAEY